jgi:serine/threonine protein kinase
VYLAEDMYTNRQVALKLLRTNVTPPTQEAIHSFEYEAKVIFQLSHPNILPLFDYGEEMVDGMLLSYVVMPFCSEGSLAAWLQQSGNVRTLSLQDVAHFIRQLADALQSAHNYGIVHQDVKPSNVFISSRTLGPPDMLLSDFGMAQVATGTSSTGQALYGTPTSMAPEQWEGHAAPATDQYALAVMLYQLLTGRPPFQGDAEQLMHEHINTPPALPSTINSSLSQGIDTVIARALAKQLGDRFITISAFATAFQRTIQPMAAPAMVIPARRDIM